MKVILLQELKGQGGEGDVIDVKRGYAVNFLLPQKIATEATKGNLKQLELRKHNIAKREAERLDSADKVLAALNEKVLVIPARVGEEGQLFGSVTTTQVAEKLNAEFGLEVDRRKIDLHAPIKTAGEHTVTVSIYRDVKAVVKVEVVDENAAEAEAEATAKVELAAVEVAEALVETEIVALDAAEAALDAEPAAVAEAEAETAIEDAEVVEETEATEDAAK
jgi:large subunit ribosomal protein L9